MPTVRDFMNQHVNRRKTLVAATTAAAAGALAIARGSNSATAASSRVTTVSAFLVEPDPALAAIAAHKAADRKARRLYRRLDEAEGVHGLRPAALIAWRNYSAIGGREIEDRRFEFLGEPGADMSRIENEYRDAKRRYRAALRAGKDWDTRNGLADLRKLWRDARRAEESQAQRLSKTQPTTLAGAAALITYVLRDVVFGETEWHLPSLKTAAAGLRQMALSRGTSTVTA